MKKVLRWINLRVTYIFAALLFAAISSPSAFSQCSTANLNWDNLDYLITTGNYSGFVTAAMSQSQGFAIGKNRVVINYPGTITTTGENVSHTGELSSYGTGADVQYSGNGNITFTFDSEVSNFLFSLYDIDVSQRVNVTATNALGFPIVITMTKPVGGSVTISGSGTTNAQGLGAGGAVANNVTTATVNVSVTGPVKTVTVAIAGTAGDFWLSDFTACVTGAFPTNYFIASQPFTGQPTYIIGTSDTNTVSLINVATGQARMIFQDVTSPRFINGIAYDHLKRDLYYVIDFTSTPQTNKAIKRYNFDTQAMGVLVADVNTLGIPAYNRGVESAGCCFYDSCLYFGIEGNLTPGNNSGRETCIWRISFNSAGTPVSACQVYATPSDDGAGVSLHDWNDFTIADGLLVDFAGSPNAAARRFTHYDLQTQAIVQNYYTGGLTPRQAGITWNNTRYWVYDNIAVYNMDGTIGAQTAITGATVLDWKGFCGDATGFRPKSDFGDAPSSYDPVALSPALHEIDTALHLGPTWDEEFNKISSVLADADGADEDGIGTVNVLDTATCTFLSVVKVYNNTGANATLVGWLDINGNGTFEASEGRSLVVPHGGPVLQSFNLAWIGINTPLPDGAITYLRIRLARAASSMTTANATGYYNNGEVEDYRVFIAGVLPVHLISFDATATDENMVKLDWSMNNETGIAGYELQKSLDGVNWQTFNQFTARNQEGTQLYNSLDPSPFAGRSFYRLKITSQTNEVTMSEVRTIQLGRTNIFTIVINPNPVKESLEIHIQSSRTIQASLRVLDVQGRTILQSTPALNEGMNDYSFREAARWPAGVYHLVMDTGTDLITQKFIVVK
jgi:hypothetical protein